MKTNSFELMLRNYRIPGHNGRDRVVLKTSKITFDKLPRRKAGNIIIDSLIPLATGYDLKITIEQIRERDTSYQN